MNLDGITCPRGLHRTNPLLHQHIITPTHAGGCSARAAYTTRQHSPCLSGWCDYVVDRVYLDHLLRTELAGRRLVCKLHLDGLDGH